MVHLADDIQFVNGFIGGSLIGISSVGLLYLTGRITGLSGIVEGVLEVLGHPNLVQKRWMTTYALGLLASGIILDHSLPKNVHEGSYIQFSIPGLIISGTLVGLGTRMGNGCTSGHGVCGLSRLSLRSGVAVATFMATGAISSFLSCETPLSILFYTNSASDVTVGVSSFPFGPVLIAIILITTYREDFWNFLQGKRFTIPRRDILDHTFCFILSIIFGIGLGISGMCNPNRVIRFLNFGGKDGWDPSLMAVMGSSVLLNLGAKFLVFSAVDADRVGPPLAPPARTPAPLGPPLETPTRSPVRVGHFSAPLTSSPSPATNPPPLGAVLLLKQPSFKDVIKFGTHESNMKIDIKLVLGAAIFGVGWGFSGICPGPGVVTLGAGLKFSTIFVPSMLIGMFIWQIFLRYETTLLPK